MARAIVHGEAVASGDEDVPDGYSRTQQALDDLLQRAKRAHGDFAAVVVSLQCEMGHAARYECSVIGIVEVLSLNTHRFLQVVFFRTSFLLWWVSVVDARVEKRGSQKRCRATWQQMLRSRDGIATPMLKVCGSCFFVIWVGSIGLYRVLSARMKATNKGHRLE